MGGKCPKWGYGFRSGGLGKLLREHTKKRERGLTQREQGREASKARRGGGKKGELILEYR